MKRSDAIEVLKKHMPMPEECCCEKCLQINAENILDVVEREVGMIPPRYRGELYDIHAWEEEDD